MTIYICGDSTASTYSANDEPQYGWGQLLGDMLPGIKVVNGAKAGRSSKSFLAEALLEPIEAELKEGDIVLIQFGHNDASPYPWRHTDPMTSFLNCLNIYIDTARTYGALPILLTQTPRGIYQDGKLMPSGGDYAAAVRLAALRRQTPLIDVYELGFKRLEAMTEEEARSLFLNVEPGVYPRFPDGWKDDTHTALGGAKLFAEIVAEGLRELGIPGRQEDGQADKTETAEKADNAKNDETAEITENKSPANMTAGAKAPVSWKKEEL